jgi:hypothetical protein
MFLRMVKLQVIFNIVRCRDRHLIADLFAVKNYDGHS